jgi:hypothetical protein
MASPSRITLPHTLLHNKKNYSHYCKENIDPCKFFERITYQSLYDDFLTDDASCYLKSDLISHFQQQVQEVRETPPSKAPLTLKILKPQIKKFYL